MRMKMLSVANYKLFKNTGEVPLSKAWNIIVGKNNAGKSALLDAFRFNRFANFPRLSMELNAGVLPIAESSVRATIWVEALELRRMLLNSDAVYLSVPQNYRQDHIGFIDLITSGDRLWPIEMLQVGGAPVRSASPRTIDIPGTYEQHSHSIFKPNQGRTGFTHNGMQSQIRDNVGEILTPYIVDEVYVFNANRRAPGKCGFSDTDKLTPDADNLAAVVAKLNLNPDRLREFDEHVHALFPSIKAVRSTQAGTGFEIRVWPVDPSTQQQDLTIPLDQCRTGVSQALAILYVALNARPGVIVIDEPNSFLHPVASKKLLEVLPRYDRHQYIISTHSPETVASIPNANIIMVTNVDGEGMLRS